MEIGMPKSENRLGGSSDSRSVVGVANPNAVRNAYSVEVEVSKSRGGSLLKKMVSFLSDRRE